MRKIVLLALMALPLFAGFFPPTVQTTVASVTHAKVSLKSPFPVNGMSGVVIHRYSDSVKAVTTYLTQTSSNGETLPLQYDNIAHEALPTVNTAIKPGDKVIGGYLYDTVLLLAPDADTYAKITASHKKLWIHPDNFAVFLAKEGESQPTKENIAAFAKQYLVGLVYIVQNGSAVLLDPVSGKIVGKKTMTGLPAKGQFPFFTRFKEFGGGWFDSKNEGNYYQVMESL